MKAVKLLLISLVISLLITGQSLATTLIEDVYTGDDNIITYAQADPINKDFFVEEDYNENYLVPYPSHDGYGIVNSDGNFFDKRVLFPEESWATGIWDFEFTVLNTTPYSWSDYHFEFWTLDFTSRLTNPGILTSWGNSIFQNSNLDNQGVLSFWAPEWQDPGETNVFTLDIDLDLAETADGFGIRQVATTVPEPSTFALMGLGLAGLGFAICRRFSIRRRKSA
jgi:hypothetical protein